ncbi:MAG: hypothetical protein WC589_15840 [Sphingobacterium sp.]
MDFSTATFSFLRDSLADGRMLACVSGDYAVVYYKFGIKVSVIVLPGI